MKILKFEWDLVSVELLKWVMTHAAIVTDTVSS